MLLVGEAFCGANVGEGGLGDKDREIGSGDECDGGDGVMRDIPNCQLVIEVVCVKLDGGNGK